MFNRKKSNVEKIRNLKLLISEKYKLPDTAIISIAELTCHEPNCPPLETVITVRFENMDGSRLANVEFPIVVDRKESQQVISYQIPDWVKNNAGWWASGQIDDKTFATGIEFLIKIGLIVV